MTEFRRFAGGPWAAGIGDPILLLVGADVIAATELREALDDLMTPIPVGDEPDPLPSFTAPGELPHVMEVPAQRPDRRLTRSVTAQPSEWTGSSTDAASFGELLAPVLLDMQRLGLLVAPAGTMQLHFDARPVADFGSRAITWSADDPDRWTRRRLFPGQHFRAADLASGREVPTFAASAPASKMHGWCDLSLLATLELRRSMSRLVELGGTVPFSATHQAEFLDHLTAVDGLIAHLLAGGPDT